MTSHRRGFLSEAHDASPDDLPSYAHFTLWFTMSFVVVDRLIEDIYVLPIGISLRVSDLVLMLLMACWTLWVVRSPQRFPIGIAGVLGSALLVLMYVAPFINAGNMTPFELDGAERGLVRGTLYACLFIAVYQLASNRQWAYRIVRLTIVMTTIQAVIAIYEAMTGSRLRALGSVWKMFGLVIDPRSSETEELLLQARLTGEQRAQATAPHPLALAGLLALGIGLCVALYLHSDSRKERRRYLAAIVVQMAGLGAANQRTGFVAIVALAVVLLVTQSHRLPQAMPLIFSGVIGGVVISLVSPGTPRLILNFFTGDSTDHNVAVRTSKYALLPELLERRPFIGPGFVTSDPSRVIFDNAYLTELIELGIVGLVLLLAFLLVVTGRSFVTMRAAAVEDQPLLLAGVCAGVTLLVTMATFDVLSFDQLFPACLMVLAVGLARADGYRRSVRAGRVSENAPAPAG